MKLQEKKTQKGNSYAIIKFSDLSTVFELFIFSDIFELNRDKLVEGNSLMITLIKNYSDDDKSRRRVNVKSILLLNEVMDKAIKNITFSFKNLKEISKLKNLSYKDGKTTVKVIIEDKNKTLTFQLKNKRNINNKLINSLDLSNNVMVE